MRVERYCGWSGKKDTHMRNLQSHNCGPAFTATGPGIRDEVTIAPVGLPDIFLTLWDENRAIFPRGVDLILVAGTDIVCLPRTTKLRRREV